MAVDEKVHPLRRHAAPVAACLASGLALGAFFLLNRITGAQAFGAFAAILLCAGLASLLSPPPRASISLRREAEGEARNMLPALIAAISDPAVALDRDGRVVAMNARMNEIAPAVRVGEPVSIGLRFPEVVEAIRRVAATGEPERVEFVERVAPGRWFETFVNPVAPSADPQAPHPALLLMVFHDLTPIRRIEEMRADFIANASHELRTPLAALSGFIETLNGPAREDPAARERFLGIMQSQANRMARLIDDLLSLSRIELNEHLRPETPVDLLAVVKQVVDALQMLARDRAVEIAVEAPSGPLMVQGDRDELIRVFENLVENALKYGASGKRVAITLARETGEAVAQVRDFGPGIAAEHLPRLTERFYRVDVAGSRAQGGTGLGLALVKHIVSRHRGQLQIASDPGQGATFTIRLKLSPGGTPTGRKT